MTSSSPAAEPSIQLSGRQKALFAVITLVLFCAVAEGLARRILGEAQPVSMPFDQVDPFISDPADPAFVITNPRLGEPSGPDPVIRPQRFGVHKAPGTSRVLLVGGSSMYQMYGEKDVGLIAQIAESAGVDPSGIELIGGGANSQGSAGDLRIVDSLLPDDLDVIVVYSGHNEYAEAVVNLIAAQGGHGVDALVHASAALQLIQREVDAWRLAKLKAGRALPTVGPGAQTTPMAGPEGPTVAAPAGGHVVSVSEVAPPTNEGVKTPTERFTEFDAHLRAIIEHARARGVLVLLCTLPGNLIAPAWPVETDKARIAEFTRLQQAGRYEDAAQIADDELVKYDHLQATSAENAVIVRVAAAEHVPLVDVLGVVKAAEPHHVSGETLLGDHCHLNDAGRKLWIDTVAPVIGAMLRERAAGPAAP